MDRSQTLASLVKDLFVDIRTTAASLEEQTETAQAIDSKLHELMMLIGKFDANYNRYTSSLLGEPTALQVNPKPPLPTCVRDCLKVDCFTQSGSEMFHLLQNGWAAQ